MFWWVGGGSRRWWIGDAGYIANLVENYIGNDCIERCRELLREVPCESGKRQAAGESGGWQNHWEAGGKWGSVQWGLWRRAARWNRA